MGTTLHCCGRYRMDEYKSAQQVLRAIRVSSAEQSGKGPRTKHTLRDALIFPQVQLGEKTRT